MTQVVFLHPGESKASIYLRDISGYRTAPSPIPARQKDSPRAPQQLGTTGKTPAFLATLQTYLLPLYTAQRGMSHTLCGMTMNSPI